MRTRTLGPTTSIALSNTGNQKWWQYLYNPLRLNGYGDTNRVTSTPGQYTYKIMNDHVVPGFYARMSRGEIISNPMDQVHTVRPYAFPAMFTLYGRWDKPNSGHYIVQDTGEASAYSLGCSDANGLVLNQPTTTWTQASEDSLVASVTAEAWARIAQAPLSAWVTVGEWNETLRLIQDILSKIRGILLVYRYGSVKKARSYYRRKARKGEVQRSLKSWAQVWLTARYGIRPLVYDLCNALEALRKYGAKNRIRFHASGTNEWVTTSAASQQMTYRTFWLYQLQTTRTVKVQVRAGVLTEPMFESAGVLDLIGLGEVIKAAWDLVPYSFVIDWFSNIGNVLVSYAPSGLAMPLTSWAVVTRMDTTERKVLSNSWQQLPVYAGSYSRTSWSGGYGSPAATNIVKTQYRLIEPHRVATPNLRVRLSVLNAVDLLALATRFMSMK